MSLSNPLGKFRNFRQPGGLISRQARISQAFKPNSLCFARSGAEHAEIPLSTAPRTDLVVLGCYEGLCAFTSSSTTDGVDTAAAIDTVTSRPQMVQIRPGIADNFATGTSSHQILAKHVDQPCFAFDDDTLYIDDLNGTLPFAGFVDAVAKDGTVSVRMGEDQRVLWLLFAAGEIVPGTSQDVTVRCVITSIAAYAGTGTATLTASATGAIGAQDGETLLAGDLVFLPLVTGGAGGATVAKDSGVWEVVDPGGATKFKLTRPAAMKHGDIIKPNMDVRVKFGTAWAGNVWKSFVTTAIKVVGTDDPAFWPRTQGYAYTIGTGFIADGGLGNAVFYLRAAHGFTALNQTSAHANWASTITTGAGTGALVFTGTASDVMVGLAINF